MSREPYKYEKWLEPENLAILKGWIDEGQTVREMAAKMGVKPPALSHYLRTHEPMIEIYKGRKKLNSKSKRKMWSKPEGLRKIAGWIEEGMTRPELADKMGVALTTLHRWQHDSDDLMYILSTIDGTESRVVPENKEAKGNREAYEELASAVVLQAMKDYQKILKKRIKHPNAKSIKISGYTITLPELNTFFNGEWCEFICGIDGRVVKRAAEKEFKEKLTRGL